MRLAVRLDRPAILRGARIALVQLVFLLAWSQIAHAYPQFQLSTGNVRCNMCHFSPAGGGLINEYGRDEAEGSLSQTAGSSRLLHGLWEPPDWLALGGDLRGAGILKQAGDEPELLGFPMQLDLYTRVAAGSFSFNAIVGMRGAARDPGHAVLGRMVSREHYVLWQPDETGLYARAGRFFAPYGLRLQDHTAYVRRFLGQHTLEETYNLSAGKIEDEWEVHATLFMSPPFMRVGTSSLGGALYYERRTASEKAAWGVQSRVAVADTDTSYWLGGVGKLWLDGPRVLLLSELNLGAQTFAFDANARLQLAAHVGATYFLTQGVLLGATVERYDPDVQLAGAARDSASVSMQYLVRSHWEIMLLGKVDIRDRLGAYNPLAMLMLHYYL